MGTITSNITRTLNGSTNFSVGSDQFKWDDGFYVVDITANVSVTATFNLSGSSWFIPVLKFNGAVNAVINDSASGSDRYIDRIELSNNGINTIKLGATGVGFITGSGGNDHVTTGLNYIDIISLGNGSNSVTVTDSIENGGVNLIQSGQGKDTFTIGNAEVLTLSSGRGDDTIKTSIAWLGYIDAGRGKDTVTLGSGGADFVALGRDADILKLTPLLDPFQVVSINGGGNVSTPADKDSDTIDFSAFTNGQKITLGMAQLIRTGQGDFLINDFENITGGKSADTFVGDNKVNILLGGGGADKLDGGLASDKLTGGTGLDTFIFKTALGTANIDTITDFDVAGETIQLDNAIFTKLAGTGVMSGVQFHSSTAGTAHDGNDRIIYDTDGGKLFYDADGNGSGAAIQFAILSKNLALGASDFVIV